jgi:ArsR family transcriptional regulator, lead/cadmium/zinc/bismuth-responsive transcriptional repressor
MKTCKHSSQSLSSHKLISTELAKELMTLFKVLTNETRLRLIHALIMGEELCVGDLAKIVGMKPQAVSNQLQRLVDKDIVASRRNGNQIHYRIHDPCVISLLELGLCLLEESKKKRPQMKKPEAANVIPNLMERNL